MVHNIDFHIVQCDTMAKYPQELYYIGDINLLKNEMVSIVGTRKPSQYTKQLTHTIAQKLSNHGITIVSGAAMGVDAIAHQAATPKNTIAVAGTSLDIRYPAVNRSLIESIEKDGLMLSQFTPTTKATRYTFPLRNELVVALGKVLIVTQADENSGTMRSVEYALKMHKEIYVLPHRLGESEGTQKLLEKKLAKAIYDVDSFVETIVGENIKKTKNDPVKEYFCTNPTYEEAMKKYPSELFEYELDSKIAIKNGKVIVL